MIVLWSAVLQSGAAAQAGASEPQANGSVAGSASQQAPPPLPPTGAASGDEGKIVRSIQLPGVPESDREHLLQLLPQKAGEPLDRGRVSDSIRALYATGRFADIQAEVDENGAGVTLTFTTSANFFVGAVDVEGAPNHPSANQIVNASKFELGELYTRDKLDKALENIRQLMQEDGYYRARVTAESVSNPATQQANILFHITAGEPAHVGEVKVTGSSGLSSAEVQSIAHMDRGDRVSAAGVSSWLQRLRKKFQKQSRVLAQVSIAEQKYHPESNAVDYTFQVDPGPVVVIYTEGFHISRGTLKREIPVYEENAVDDDLLNEGKRNLLDYLQTRGHFDAKVEIQKETDAEDHARDLPHRPWAHTQAGSGGDHREQGVSGYGQAEVLSADSAGEPLAESRTL